MKEQILSSQHNPEALEQLYRSDEQAFAQAFTELKHELGDTDIVKVWQARLRYQGVVVEELAEASDGIQWGGASDLIFVIIASLLTSISTKLIEWFDLNDALHAASIGFYIFPFLIVYFLWKRKPSFKVSLGVMVILFLSALFIYTVPDTSHLARKYGSMNGAKYTTILSYIHLPLFLWSLLGIAYTSNSLSSQQGCLSYLRFNGNMVIMAGLILIAGMLLTAGTLALFSVIRIHIQGFYFDKVVRTGVVAAPIMATYIVMKNPTLVGKVSPLIAKIFSPLVFITLLVYLILAFTQGKNPYDDREFLLIFNVLLISVMALIFFSVSEEEGGNTKGWNIIMITLLSTVTIIVNSVALSAILFRISEWGITPNRVAVLGGNIIIFIHLIWIYVKLISVARGKAEVSEVHYTITRYLPVFTIWTIIVTFLFPFLFGFQ